MLVRKNRCSTQSKVTLRVIALLPSANEVMFSQGCVKNSVHGGGRDGHCSGRHATGGDETATAADGTHPTGMHSCVSTLKLENQEHKSSEGQKNFDRSSH